MELALKSWCHCWGVKVFFTSVEVRPELGSIDLVGKSGTECVLANKKG